MHKQSKSIQSLLWLSGGREAGGWSGESRRWGCAVVWWGASVLQCFSQHSSTPLPSAVQLLGRYDYEKITLHVTHLFPPCFIFFYGESKSKTYKKKSELRLKKSELQLCKQKKLLYLTIVRILRKYELWNINSEFSWIDSEWSFIYIYIYIYIYILGV